MNNDEKICSLQKVTTKDCMDYASERTDSYLVLDTAEKVECQTKLAETVHVYVENYAIDLEETDNFVLFGTEFLQEQNKLKYRFRFDENVILTLIRTKSGSPENPRKMRMRTVSRRNFISTSGGTLKIFAKNINLRLLLLDAKDLKDHAEKYSSSFFTLQLEKQLWDCSYDSPTCYQNEFNNMTCYCGLNSMTGWKKFEVNEKFEVTKKSSLTLDLGKTSTDIVNSLGTCSMQVGDALFVLQVIAK